MGRRMSVWQMVTALHENPLTKAKTHSKPMAGHVTFPFVKHMPCLPDSGRSITLNFSCLTENRPFNKYSRRWGREETRRQTGERSEFCLFSFGGNPGVTWLQTGQSQENLDRLKPIRSLQWEAWAWCCCLTAVQSHYNSMVTGFSKNLRNSASHCAPTAPSTTRWSQLNVTDIMLATSNLQHHTNCTVRFIANKECPTCSNSRTLSHYQKESAVSLSLRWRGYRTEGGWLLQRSSWCRTSPN